MQHASARKLLENNFSILSLTFRVSNSDVQRVLMISRVFAITRFLQKRSNKPRLPNDPHVSNDRRLAEYFISSLIGTQQARGGSNKDMWTRKFHEIHNFSLQI